jgi:hypothetical protein
MWFFLLPAEALEKVHSRTTLQRLFDLVGGKWFGQPWNDGVELELTSTYRSVLKAAIATNGGVWGYLKQVMSERHFVADRL